MKKKKRKKKLHLYLRIWSKIEHYIIPKKKKKKKKRKEEEEEEERIEHYIWNTGKKECTSIVQRTTDFQFLIFAFWFHMFVCL